MMEKEEIFVPLLVWLIGAKRIGGSYNVYCGSRGTSAETGCFGKDIFNYRIWIEEISDDENGEDKQEFIKACVYYGLNSYENQNEEDILTEIFPCNNEGLEEIKKWLEERAEAFFS